MSAESPHIFISYGRKDSRDIALRLRQDLLAVGYSVWFDQNEIPGGADWSAQIEAAIEQCDILLALLSPAAYESQWCRAEQLRALRKGKRLVPLMVVAGADVPLHLEHLNYLDFTTQAHYDAMFRDLLSDISAGLAFRQPNVAALGQGGFVADGNSPYESSALRGRSDQREKRTAPSFRRHLRDLRAESWLGARYWWPYFLFHFADLHQVIDTLESGVLHSPVAGGADFNSRWDQFVRLYFRPRTPDLYHAEGHRNATQQPVANEAPIPVYLLFDLDSVILYPEARFSDGDPEITRKTYKTPAYFRDLPFEQIYHDSWFTADEREEIMRYRSAQVLIPDQIGLESLQLIWMRSPAEYETLRHLLPPDVWLRWRDKITARADYHLFNNHRPYVQTASLTGAALRLRFNPCQGTCQPYHAQAIIDYDDGQQVRWNDEAFIPEDDLEIALPRAGQYSVQFLLDGRLAYANQRQPELDVL